MSETDPTPTPSQSDAPAEPRAAAGPGNSGPVAGVKPPRRRRRRWLIVLGVILLLLIILVLLIPTIASSGAARGYVLGKVNENLNGHVQVDDWSLGWGGNFRLDGLRVTDSAGSQLLKLEHVTAHPSIWSVIHGRYDLGKIVVDGLDFTVVREKDGTLNFATLAKTEPKPGSSAPAPAAPKEEKNPPPTEAKSAPTKLPDVHAEFVLQNCHATIDDRQAGQMVYLKSLDCDVNVPDINQPITESIKAVIALGQNAPGTISIDGQTLLVKNNELLTDPAQILSEGQVEHKVSLTNLNLASIAPFLGSSGIDRLEGILNEEQDIQLKPNQDGSFHTQLTVTGLNVGMNKQVVLSDDALNFQTAGSFASSGGTKSVSFAQLDLADKQGLLGLKNGSPDPLRVGLASDGALQPSGGIDFSYDLAKLWKVVFPLLSPSTRDSLKDIAVAGQYTKRISVAGSYPAGVPANVALRSLQLQAGLTVGSLTGKGLDIKDFDIPVNGKDGKFTVAFSDKPGDYPKPATFNGGQLSLAGAMLDLSGPHPRLNMIPGTYVLRDIGINPALANALGNDVGNFLFASASTSSGKLSVLIPKCDRFPLDDLYKQQGPENDGSLQTSVSISDVELAGGSIGKLSEALAPVLSAIKFKGSLQVLRGAIKDYSIRIEKGVSTHDMTLFLVQEQRTLKLNGTVGLEKMNLAMNLVLPWELFGAHDKILTSALPNGIELPVGGTVSDPKFDVQGLLQKSLFKNFQGNPQDLIKGLPDLFGKKKPKDQQGSNSTPDNSQTQPAATPDNPLDLLGNLLNKDKKKDKK